MSNAAARLVADHVQISTGKTGLRPLAQNGRIEMDDHSLSLLNNAGQLLAQAPIATITLTAGRGIAAGLTRVTIGGETYTLAIGAGGRMLVAGLLRIPVAIRGRRRLAATLAATQPTDTDIPGASPPASPS